MGASKSQANKLGDRLRKTASPAPEDLSDLQTFRARYDEPMVTVQARLELELGLKTTARLKTVNTIVEKLKREKTRLAEMQDIAGVRIAPVPWIADQDAMITRIVGLFPEHRIVDRRRRPSHGYRAVHVIAWIDDLPVEIQVRTDLQDSWAQMMEALADLLGRDIRYGEAPAVGVAFFEQLLKKSAVFAEAEDAVEEAGHLLAHPPGDQDELRSRSDSVQAHLSDVAKRLMSGRQDLTNSLEELQSILIKEADRS